MVAPPSIHPKTGEAYEWVNGGEIAEAPGWLLEKLRGAPKVAQFPATDSSISEGQRNSELASIAGQMRARGMEADDIAAILQEINTRRCEPPLPVNEVVKIAESIARYPADGTFPLTDVGNAQRLVARHGHDLRYCFPWKGWLCWDGCRWIVDRNGEIMRRAKESKDFTLPSV